MASISGLFYVFNALILFAITLKLWQSYQKTKNLIQKNFVYLFFFCALSFLLFGLPSLIIPQSPFGLKTAYLISLSLLLIGFSFGTKSLIAISPRRISPKVGVFFALALGLIVILLEAFHFGQPKISYGIIMWNLEPSAILIFSFLLFALTIPLTVEFIRHGLRNPEIRIRCFWLAATSFLVGVGGCFTHLNAAWPILIFGHIIMSFGWISGAIAFIFTKPKKISIIGL